MRLKELCRSGAFERCRENPSAAIGVQMSKVKGSSFGEFDRLLKSLEVGSGCGGARVPCHVDASVVSGRKVGSRRFRREWIMTAQKLYAESSGSERLVDESVDLVGSGVCA